MNGVVFFCPSAFAGFTAAAICNQSCHVAIQRTNERTDRTGIRPFVHSSDSNLLHAFVHSTMKPPETRCHDSQ